MVCVVRLNVNQQDKIVVLFTKLPIFDFGEVFARERCRDGCTTFEHESAPWGTADASHFR